ncbi:MAG: hypothetical protein DID89_2727548396 [Candidatus Nitrotoga sp. CP45]|nr:MAG: hypothetical protein DID89_2727548396 [Candidatus Nitrotoga sp. CP45]
MSLSDREKNALEALSGTAKSALSLIPGLGQAIAGWDEYRRSQFNQNILALLQTLDRKVSDVQAFTTSKWLQTEDGQQFCWKVFSSALDSQLGEKQELFVNAFVQGVSKPEVAQLEKLKFIDMLRQLSKAALMVLADMHAMYAPQVRGPGRQSDPIGPYPMVEPTDVAEKLSNKYDPYLVTAAVYELQSHGLFSTTGEWRKMGDGTLRPGGGFQNALCYTDFAARFVEFISAPETQDA